VWEKAGFRVLQFPDIHRMIWEKLICNIAFSGPCTLTGLTIGEACDNPDAFPVSAACATEAFLVAKAKGVAVDIDDPIRYVREFGSKIPGARPSMLLDHMAGRVSEIETPLWKRFGGGCHLNRAIGSLIECSGFRIDQLENSYLPGPKPLTFIYEGRARLR
jgi:Ketopantoate reductase PanE/ApbA C terminal